MAEIDEIGVVDGIPTTGTGEVPTLAPVRDLLTTIDADTGNIATSTSGAATSLAVIDDWDENDRAKVNLIAGQVGVAGGSGPDAANAVRVALIDEQVATPQTTAQAMAAEYQLVAFPTDGVGVKVDDAAFTPGTSTVLMVGMQADEGSTDSVDEGDAGAPRMTLDRKVITNPQPHTGGGLSVFRSLDLDETEEEAKDTGGNLYKLRIANFRTSSAVYVKLYDADADDVSVGTTTPIDTIAVPPASAAGNPTIITEAFGGMGLTFANAITLAATTGLADNDTGAPGANEVVVSAYYK